MDFGKIANLGQKLEFLSQSKIRKNKSLALAFHSYELFLFPLNTLSCPSKSNSKQRHIILPLVISLYALCNYIN